MKISQELKIAAERAFKSSVRTDWEDDYVDFTCIQMEREGKSVRREWESIYRPRGSTHSAWLRVSKYDDINRESDVRLAMLYAVARGTDEDVETMQAYVQECFDKYVLPCQ